MLSWLAWTSHIASLKFEPTLFFSGVGHALTRTLFTFMLYVALEPYIRKFLPHSLVSWSRLLTGRWRDVSVGNDVLVGLTVAGAMSALIYLGGLGVNWHGLMTPPSAEPVVATLLGQMFLTPVMSLGMVLMWMFLYVLIRLIAGKPRYLAEIVLFGFVLLLLLLIAVVNGAAPQYALIVASVSAIGYTFLILRCGFLALYVAAIVNSLITYNANTLDFSSWYVAPTVVIICVIATAIAFGYRTATNTARSFKIPKSNLGLSQ